MDPLSTTASALAIITATITSIKALYGTVDRYKGRDKTLGRLQGGLWDLITILNSLEAVANTDTPVMTLLKGPVGRCSQMCREFEKAMEKFSGKTKPGLTDWLKMEFMRGDINDFIDHLADYKSTIAIGLGAITMHTSILTQQVVEEYNEMIKDTHYNLEIHLQRIEDKITRGAIDRAPSSEDPSIDLRDEKAVTEQCLYICERASFMIKSLTDEQPALKVETPQQNNAYVMRQFEAQLLTQKSLHESRHKFLETANRVRERLDSINFNGVPDDGSETSRRLQEEANYSKQLLEVLEHSSKQVSSQKIYIVGDVTAAVDSDQVVVTTLADLFQVGNVKAADGSAQLVGSMEGDVFRDVSKDRYNSRFGALGSSLDNVQLDTSTASPSTSATRKADRSPTQSNQAKGDGALTGSETTYERPTSNEVRRRKAGGEDGTKKTGP